MMISYTVIYNIGFNLGDLRRGILVDAFSIGEVRFLTGEDFLVEDLPFLTGEVFLAGDVRDFTGDGFLPGDVRDLAGDVLKYREP